MVRPFLAVLALVPALSACADDYGDRQACAQPEVLQLVSDRLEKAGLPRRMLTEAIGQAPGRVPGTVLCSVWVQHLVYDTPIRGNVPANAFVPYQYQLQLRQNSAFLLPDPSLTAASR